VTLDDAIQLTVADYIDMLAQKLRCKAPRTGRKVVFIAHMPDLTRINVLSLNEYLLNFRTAAVNLNKSRRATSVAGPATCFGCSKFDRLSMLFFPLLVGAADAQYWDY
jgi:hypothetical protein